MNINRNIALFFPPRILPNACTSLIRFLAVIIFFILILTNDASSQSCANYSVSRATGITYSSIVGTGTSNFVWRNTAGNQNDDNRSVPVSIGFDYWYLGVKYTTISASLNGIVDFSASTLDGNTGAAYGPNYSNYFSTANGTMLALAPVYADLWTAGYGTTPIATSIIYKQSGTAPNRVLTVEWINFDVWNSPSNPTPASFNFQVKIYETTGAIEFVYGTMTAGSSGSGTYPLAYTCGINSTWASGSPTAAQLLTQQTANTTTFSSTPQNALGTPPATNSKLTFTPPTPTAAPTGLSFSSVSKTGMTLNWSNTATNEVGYVIYNSTDNVNFSFVTQKAVNAVSAVITGLVSSTTYYWRVYAVTEGKLSSALAGTRATLAGGSITSIATGNWNNTTTWDCGCLPTAGDNVIIDDGNTVTLNTNGACNSLTIGQGSSGQLTIGNSGTARTLTVSTDVTVNAGATMTTGTTAATHSMTIGGDLTNDGTLNLAPTATRVCNVTFNKNGDQILSGGGATTNFNRITLNMGTSNTNVLDIASTNFTVVPTNFLTLTNGTFKLSTATDVLTPFTSAVTIPFSSGIWLNNAGATMSSTGGTITLYGYVRVTAGTLNIGNASNNNLTSYGGTVTIDGGTVNIAGRLDGAGFPILTYFTMSSGVLTLATVGSTTATLAPFTISEPGSSFTMSGGTIIIRRPGAGNLAYLNTGGTFGTVSGGTLQIGDASTPASQTMQINSTIPIHNLVVSNGVAVTAQLSTNSLTVNNDVTINSGTLDLGTFTANRASTGGTLTLASGATLLVGGSSGGVTGSNFPNNFSTTTLNGTVNFNGTGMQTIPAFNYNNLTSSSTGARTLASSGTIGVAGTLTVGTNTYTVTGSTLDYNGSGAQTVIAFNYNNLTSSSTGIRTLASSGTIGIAGAFSPGTNAYTITGSTINFNGTGTQTIPAFNYNNLTSSSTGARTLASSGTIGVAGTLTVGTNTYTVTGSTIDYNGSGGQAIIAFTYNNLTSSSTGTRTLASSGTIGVAGAFTPGTNTYTVTGSTINYNGSGGQSVVVFGYNNLTISGSGSETAAGNLSVTGAFSNSTVFTMDTFTLSITGSKTNTGTIQFAGAANGVVFSNGTIEYNGAVSQTVSPGTYANLIFSNSGTKNITGAVITTGNTTINLSAPITVSVAGSLSVTGNFSNAGAITNQGAITVGP